MVNKLPGLFAAMDVFYAASMVKNSELSLLPNGKWGVVSKKSLGSPNEIDLSELPELTYSAIMRELRKNGDYEAVKNFLSIYKQIFDGLINLEMTDAADKALPVTIMIFSKLFPVKLSGSEDD